MSFCLIPAIDLKNGACVRLRQGSMNDVTVYSTDPLEMAKNWVSKNAGRIHLVDLEGALSGHQENSISIKKILKEFGNTLPIQVGGGIRDLQTVEKLLNFGASYVVIGTAAVKNPAFLAEACSAFPNNIIVSLDARDEKVATHGWSKTSNLNLIDVAKSIETLNVKNILYTDISRDGMQIGINITTTLKLAKAVKIPIIASGGLASIEEIEELSKCYKQGVTGVILGKALYEGNICLEDVVEQLNRKSDSAC